MTFLPESAQPMRDCQNSTDEKPLYFQAPVYYSGLFVYDSIPNFSLFHVQVFLSFVLWIFF